MRLKLLELDALLEDVAWKAQTVRPSSSEGLSQAEELGLLLFVSTFEVFLGMRALLRERLAEEARMLSRALLEDTARLVWLATSAEELNARALNYTLSSIEYEQHLYRVARDNGYEWAESALEGMAKELAAVKDDAEKTGVALERLPTAREMLHSLGQGKLYYWHVLASQVIHSSRIGLSARFLPPPEGERPIGIMLESSIKEVARVGAMAIDVFSLAIVAANDVLGWDRRDELVVDRDRVKRLSGEFYERIKNGALPQESSPEHE